VSEQFLNKLKRRIDTFRIGHPLDKGVDMGALVDESQSVHFACLFVGR
jgi:aldehyde dehydrogenase (NAD+)